MIQRTSGWHAHASMTCRRRLLHFPTSSGPSELSNERTQQLYRRLGYKDCGTLLMPEEPLETLFSKRLA
jgi:hypothetical protein